MSADDFRGLERFDDVDSTGEAEMFARFLEQVESAPSVVARRQRSFDLLALRDGDAVADVGCGLGTAARELAARGARAYGFDASEEMVAEARRRTDAGGIEFAVGEATALPLEDGALRGYRAERVYQHLDDPEAALREARRVLGPDGRIVLIDQDWDAFVVDGGPDTGAILRAFADSFRNGRIGRQYRRLLLDAGFRDVVVEPETSVFTEGPLAMPMAKLAADAGAAAGLVAREAADAWLADQAERLANGSYFAAMTHFVASASR